MEDPWVTAIFIAVICDTAYSYMLSVENGIQTQTFRRVFCTPQTSSLPVYSHPMMLQISLTELFHASLILYSSIDYFGLLFKSVAYFCPLYFRFLLVTIQTFRLSTVPTVYGRCFVSMATLYCCLIKLFHGSFIL